MDFLNAIILLLNYIFIPALTYGSQLALGAIFVTLIYGILRFANFATGDMMSFGTMMSNFVYLVFSISWHFIGSSTNCTFSNSFCSDMYDFIYVIYR
jgi:branched-subunit amino acid ABC-type transport system permease component